MRSVLRAAHACALMLALSVGRARAQQPPSLVAGASVDSALLGVVSWRSLGPTRGGRVVAVAGDPNEKLTFYMGATGGGVWKTEDAGISWRNLSDGYFSSAAVGAIAVSPSDPRVIYVGTGEACIRGDVEAGDGVYRSSDGGRTWVKLGLDKTRHIARIRIHPTNPDIVYVAVLGDAFGPSTERGVYKSIDGGQHWERVLYRDDKTGAIDLVLDATNPSVMYASMLEERRFPWGLRSAGPGSGLFKSTDGGAHWTELTQSRGFPSGVLGRIGVALSKANPQRVYAIVDAARGQKGVYRSDDGGTNWERASDDANLTQRPWYYHHIVADPTNADVLYVMNVDFWRSSDAGKSWTRVRPPHGDHHDLWIDPADPRRMIEGNDGGATVSLDGGKSWSGELTQPTAQIYHVTTDEQFPYRVYGAQQDHGGISLPVWSDADVVGPSDWETFAGGESGYIAVDPTDPGTIYSGEHHWLVHYDRRSRQGRDISPSPETHYGWGARDIRYRFQWTYPVMLSPRDPRRLYAAAQVLFRSTTKGQSWQIISPDLTRHDPRTLERTPVAGDTAVGPSWGPITRDNTGVEWYATIFALAESPVTQGVIWTGSDDGLVHVSRDDGKTWTNVTPAELPEFSLVSIIEPSPFDAAEAYVAATRYKLQDRSPYLFHTRDYGRSWTRIDATIPRDDFTRVIRADPVRRGLLFAGTESGVYVSFDDGTRWTPLRRGLPVASVHDLALHAGDLIAATHGRGFWVLDHEELLRQIDDRVAGVSVHLFAPPPVVRRRVEASVAASTDAVGSYREGTGRNPPTGVVFRYLVRTSTPQEVRLTVTDSGGNIVRVFPDTGRVPGRAVTARPKLFAHDGVNELVWNLRYPAPTPLLPGAVLPSTVVGPLAPPGPYRASLSVGDRTYSTTFVIRRDPRIAATDADLRAQFALLRDIHEELIAVHAIYPRAKATREAAEAAMSALAALSRSDPRVLRAQPLLDRARRVEESLVQIRARAPQDLSNYPTAIDGKLAKLAELVEQADAGPTEAEREKLADLKGRVARALAELGQVELALRSARGK